MSKRGTMVDAINKAYTPARMKRIKKALDRESPIFKTLSKLWKQQKRERERFLNFNRFIDEQIEKIPFNPKERMPIYWRTRYNKLNRIKKNIEYILT